MTTYQLDMKIHISCFREESGERPVVRSKSFSQVSDCSALPDLEGCVPAVEDIGKYINADKVETKSLENICNQEESQSVSEKKVQDMKALDERQQMLRDTKAWIHNSLMTVVGVGVLAYLQTLESSM